TVELPEERFDLKLWYDPDDNVPGKSCTCRASLIDGFNEFDSKLFGITDAEVERMDPQQKLLLECTFRALEDAGIPMEKASGTSTGVFIGLMNRDYEMILNNVASTINHYNGTGTAMSIAANRISYCFNFTGPSFSIDSACSSSLVALHYACDCEMAICGGVSCILEPRIFVSLSKAKMISPEGVSKPFSNKADGYGRGEGCGIVLLKPLEKALKDLDHIRGIITCSAVNQDGRTVTPITRPSMMQQEQLLHSIYSKHVDPSHIQYIEAHGTGTSAGDPTEASSISNVVAKCRSAGSPSLVIGSVKGNIGHTESAAGVAGLIKILLMMQHETLVPSLHYSKDNASIDTEALNLKIPTKAEKWESRGPLGRAAGVNNFGFGGTNAHVVVRQYKETRVLNHRVEKGLKLFVLSAASEKAIHMTMADTVRIIESSASLELQDLAYTSACRRSHTKHRYRKAFVTPTLENLTKQIQTAANTKIAAAKSDQHLVFVFCGNGVTYKGMCKQLVKEESIFREKIIEIENIFNKYASFHLLDRLENEKDYNDFTKPEIIQPLLFAIQVALSSLLSQWSIKPNAVLGHSVGEVAAAHCSGLLSLQDAVKVIYYRSILQAKVTGGKMLVVSNIAVSDLLGFVNSSSRKISIAAFNSPQSCTLSGDAESIDDIHRELSLAFSSKNIFLYVLDVPAAYHSPMMDPILKTVEEEIGLLKTGPMTTDLISTVTGQFISTGDFTTGQYWAKNVREPVCFEQAVKSVVSGKKDVVFVEIGPRRALQRSIMEILGSDTSIFPTVQPSKDYESLLTVVTKLFELGFDISWEQFYQGCETLPSPYPRYQFDHVKKEVSSNSEGQINQNMFDTFHPLLHGANHDQTIITCKKLTDVVPYIYEHKNNGVAIVPGSFYAEIALASAMANQETKRPVSFLQLEIKFHKPLTVNQNSMPLQVQFESQDEATAFKIYSSEITYALGRIQTNSENVNEERQIAVDSVRTRCEIIVTSETIYEKLSNLGFQYRGVFRQLGNIYKKEEFKEAITKIRVPEKIQKEMHKYFFHPVILDYFLQMSSFFVVSAGKSRPGFPSAIGSLIISAPLQSEMFMYMKVTKSDDNCTEVCGCFTDTNGFVLAELKHVQITFIGSGLSITRKFTFQNEWVDAPEEQVSQSHPKCLVFADQLGVAQLVKHHLHPDSVYISNKDTESAMMNIGQYFVNSEFTEILFFWGIKIFDELYPENVLQHLTNCCEAYQQIIIMLNETKYSCTIKTITYRASENTVDQMSTGFALWGMSRACAAEIFHLSFQVIDIGSVNNEDIVLLGKVITSYESQQYPEVMIRKGRIYHSSIKRAVEKEVWSNSNHQTTLDVRNFALNTTNPYGLEHLQATVLIGSNNKTLSNDGVEIQISKICLHSSDYFPVSLNALRFGETMYWTQYSNENHQLLCLDFSGIVTTVGSNVTSLKPGDHIISCFPVGAASRVLLPESVCCKSQKIPFLKEVPCVSFFILAWEILVNVLPTVRPPRQVGIISSFPQSTLCKIITHGANKCGMHTEIITKRNTEQVINSEALIFLNPTEFSSVRNILSITTASHIVIVCNSDWTLNLLKMPKSDNEHVHIHVIQLMTIFQKTYLTKHSKSIFKWVKSLKLEKSLLDIPTKVLQSDIHNGNEVAQNQILDSYFMAKTIQLVVLQDDFKRISKIPLFTPYTQLFRRDGVYLVTGGLSGLGFETVKFIAQHGGGYIVILSRSAPTPERQADIVDLQTQFGATISNICCDVAIPKDVKQAISAIKHTYPSVTIRGIFHSAVVLHDGLIHTLSKSDFEKVMRPKVVGVLNLHNTTRRCQLDYFVCYSSIASFLGNSAQANYAAANSFLDMFCHYRRRIGLPGQSINWGALNTGLLLNKDKIQQFLEQKGLMTLDVPEIHECLEYCLVQSNPQIVASKFHFQNLSKHFLSSNVYLRQRFYSVMAEEIKHLADTSEISQGNSISNLENYVITLLCDICGMDAEEVTNDTSLLAFGIDSMLAMTVQNRMFQDRNVNVPLVKLMDPNTTVSMLVSLFTHSSMALSAYKVYKVNT
uniref:Reducing polyketide synthase PKS1-like n=1 Tax=Erpetoichthys calabaricus TaxID=27687 RepID=A0A8C4RWS8_ERPCA